jgi:hypothetical protein
MWNCRLGGTLLIVGKITPGVWNKMALWPCCYIVKTNVFRLDTKQPN